MPELPEVETVRRGLEQTVLGATVVGVQVHWERIVQFKEGVEAFKHAMVKQTLQQIDRRGKYLLFYWQDYGWISHLRMEGKYLVVPTKQEVDRYTHVILTLSDGRDLRYRDVRKFGRIRMIPRNEMQTAIANLNLGVEPNEVKTRDLVLAFKKTQRLIKAVLLDQSIVSGIGNIYADEILWQAGIHPERKANTLTEKECETLKEAIVNVIQRAVEAGGTTIRTYRNTFGEDGHFQLYLNAYGKTGTPCSRCQTLIVKKKVAQRGTHYCPNCQKLI